MVQIVSIQYCTLKSLDSKANVLTRGLAEGKISNVDEQQKSSDDLTTDFLTALVKHLMYTLEQKVGETILRTIPIEFCLTVPAIWSEVAKDKTLKACQKAGLKSKSEILLVSEPVSNDNLS